MKLDPISTKFALPAIGLALGATLYFAGPADAEPSDEAVPADLMATYGVGPDAAADIRALDWWETRDRAAITDDQFLTLITLYNGYADHERDILSVECLSFAVQWMATGRSTPVQLASIAMIVRDTLNDDAAHPDTVFAAAHAARMLRIQHDPDVFARLMLHQQRLAADAELTAWMTEVFTGIDSPYRRHITD